MELTFHCLKSWFLQNALYVNPRSWHGVEKTELFLDSWSLWALYHILTLNSGSIGQCVVQGEQKILSRLPCSLHVDLSPKKGFTT